jgi:RimJ/RimL family protein N-acetyltransferase
VPDHIPQLETERLLLRGWLAEDVEAYARMNRDPLVRRYMWPGRVLSVSESYGDVGAMVDQWRRIGFGHWAVVLKESGETIGRTGAKQHADWPLGPDNCEVGWLYAREAWGKGYATEGARAALRFMFEQARREEVISIAHPRNRASHRVMERIGLARAGAMRWEAREMDVVWYSRRADEAAAPRSAAL